MRPIDEVLNDLNPWIIDPRVARFEIFQDKGQTHIRAVVHMEPHVYTRLAVGAVGSGADIQEALRMLIQKLDGGPL